MAIEKRKNNRRTFERSGFIKRSRTSRLEPCVVVDVSQSGARLACTTPQSIPDQFALVFSPTGGVVRDCVVVWRKGFELGVRFVRTEREKASPSR